VQGWPGSVPDGKKSVYRWSGVRFLRQNRLSLALFIVAGLIGLAAIADHRHKQVRINSAQLDAYYCTHHDTRCGGPSWTRIEDAWQQRQVGYELVVAALGGFSIGRALRRPPARS